MIQNFLIADGSVFLIPILIFLPLIVFIIVVIVLCIKGLHQNISDAVNGHTVQIVTGYGYVQLIIDGKTVDELRSFQIYTAKLNANIDGLNIVANIGTGFCRYRITTFINGVKQATLSN